MTGGCSGTRACAPGATGTLPRTWFRTPSRRQLSRGGCSAGTPAAGSGPGYWARWRNKDISGLRRKAALRRRQPEIHARYQGAAADTEAQALNAIALARAREVIDDMPPRQKEIALMRWRDHLRAAEIAATLGIAEGTVHAQLHGARRKLVAGLERYYPFGGDSEEGATS
jgi:DNA-binding CsgD family transcriptional regulator